MKGQFIAVEAVLSLGIGLMVAVGLITAFSTFQGNIMKDVETSQIDTVQSEVSTTIMSLSQSNISSARVGLDLPRSIGDSSYQLDLDRGSLYILVADKTYETRYEAINSSYSFSGSAEGGKVSILKEDDKLIVRED